MAHKAVVFVILTFLTKSSVAESRKSRDSSDNNGGVEYHVPEGGSLALNCSQNGSPPTDTWLNVTWVLPDLTLIQRDTGNLYESRGTTFSLSADGQELYLQKIKPEWYGDYYCMVLYDPRQFYVTKFGVNTSFNYSDVLRKEYRHVVVIIGVACGTLLTVVILIFALVTWCRHSARRRHDSGSTSTHDLQDPIDQSTLDVPDKAAMWATYQSMHFNREGNAYPATDKTV